MTTLNDFSLAKEFVDCRKTYSGVLGSGYSEW